VQIILSKILLFFFWTAVVFHPASGVSQTTCQYDRTRQLADAATYGEMNVLAPDQLSQFAFLIGKWKCDVTITEPDGRKSTYNAIWTGRYMLDGYAISDEFRMTDESGRLVMLGSNFRTYDPDSESWEMKWYEALGSTWREMSPRRLGNVQFTDSTISYKTWFKPGIIHRITFSEICEDQFTWTIDSSTDNGKTWKHAIMVIRAVRSER
jgi:hypothetical protein